ncbi:tRNA1(Val) (adenine(37)-N6)-methyltransferase [Shewanella donghaensis]|uniref:tRNA1(Val) (adenine(37)-N6)-methyltransferase n=1 Tax=Shewanella donghaensis TaxID=238836 RepID=UPI0011821306|nr:RlmF-related methyltransferase [Shewanella donghaensis]
MSFTFKQFHIDDSHCGMPVSTDGVILGAWAKIEHGHRVLDIGSGSGLLSLMVAQRQAQIGADLSETNPSSKSTVADNTVIVAVELDDSAAQDCQLNILNSPWASCIEFHHSSIQNYAAQHLEQALPLFNSIICNPPFFDNGPQSENKERASARHTDSLSYSELLNQIVNLLSEDGYASLILPTESEARFTTALADTSLGMSKRVAVSTVINKPARRLLIELKHQSQISTIEQSNFVISNQDGQYSAQMANLCKAFYLKL